MRLTVGIVALAGMSSMLFGDVDATPGTTSAQCTSSSSVVKALNKEVTFPLQFCWFWTLKGVTRNPSPLKSLSSDKITQACHCVMQKPSLGRNYNAPHGSTPKKSKTSCQMTDGYVQYLRSQMQSPPLFCKFWTVG